MIVANRPVLILCIKAEMNLSLKYWKESTKREKINANGYKAFLLANKT